MLHSVAKKTKPPPKTPPIPKCGFARYFLPPTVTGRTRGLPGDSRAPVGGGQKRRNDSWGARGQAWALE